MSKSQSITRSQIRQRVGAQSFERGEAYAGARNIFNARQMGTVLKSDCHGSNGNVYRLWAKVEKQRLACARVADETGQSQQ